MAAITSGLNENLSFLDRNEQLSGKINAANAAAASYMQRAGIAESIGGVAQTAGNLYGSMRQDKRDRAGTITRTKKPGTNTKG